MLSRGAPNHSEEGVDNIWRIEERAVVRSQLCIVYGARRNAPEDLVKWSPEWRANLVAVCRSLLGFVSTHIGSCSFSPFWISSFIELRWFLTPRPISHTWNHRIFIIVIINHLLIIYVSNICKYLGNMMMIYSWQFKFNIYFFVVKDLKKLFL